MATTTPTTQEATMLRTIRTYAKAALIIARDDGSRSTWTGYTPQEAAQTAAIMLDRNPDIDVQVRVETFEVDVTGHEATYLPGIGERQEVA